jgi:hypothetical protein
MTSDGKRKHPCRDPGLRAPDAKPLEEACEDSVCDYMAGTVSRLFEVGEHGQWRYGSSTTEGMSRWS